MECSQCQATAGQTLVNLRHAKGQSPVRNPVPSLNPADLFAQGIDLGGGGGHD
jgi:hypothetical protein